MSKFVNYHGSLVKKEMNGDGEEVYHLVEFYDGKESLKTMKLRSMSGQLKASVGDGIRFTLSKTEPLVDNLAVCLEKFDTKLNMLGLLKLIRIDHGSCLVFELVEKQLIESFQQKLSDEIGNLIQMFRLTKDADGRWEDGSKVEFDLIGRVQSVPENREICIVELDSSSRSHCSEIKINSFYQFEEFDTREDGSNCKLINVLKDRMNAESETPKRRRVRVAVRSTDVKKAIEMANDGSARLVVIEGGPLTGKTHALAFYITILMNLEIPAVVMCTTKNALDNVRKEVENLLVERKNLNPDVIVDVDTYMSRQKKAQESEEHKEQQQQWNDHKDLESQDYCVQWDAHSKKLDDIVMKKVCDKVKIVFATLEAGFVKKMIQSGYFKPEECLIDAAQQVMKTQTCHHDFSSIKRFIIAGDSKQLPVLPVEQEINFEEHPTLMDHLLLHKENIKYIMLNICFTSEEILEWSNEMFYSKSLISLPEARELFTRLTFDNGLKGPKSLFATLVSRMVLFDTSLEREDNEKPKYFEKKVDVPANNVDQKSMNFAYFNEGEAEIVIGHITAMIFHGNGYRSIAVITNHWPQIELLEKMLKENNLNNVQVGTSDHFQGQSFDAVIYSMVRCNPAGKWLRCLADLRRLSVAMTRATTHFCLIGSSYMLKNRAFPDLEKLLPKFRCQVPPCCARGQPAPGPMGKGVKNYFFGKLYALFEKHTDDQYMIEWIKNNNEKNGMQDKKKAELSEKN